MNFTARQRKEQRRKAAEERAAAHQALSLEERLAKAQAAPGDSTREISRIERQIRDRDLAAEIAASKEQAEKVKSNKKPSKGGKPAGKNIAKTPA